MVALRTGQPVRDCVMGIQDPKRGLRWLRVNAQPLLDDPPGAAQGALATFTDITEKTLASQRLREREALFHGLFDQAAFLAGILDENGHVLEVNGRAVEAIGLTRDEILGRPFRSLPVWADSKDLEHLDALLDQARRGVAGRFETSHTLAGGGRIQVLFHAMPERLDSSLRIVVVGIDITGRKLAEDALRASERRFHLASDGGQVGVWDLELATGTAWRSACHARIFGAASTDTSWSTQQLMERLHPDDRAAVAQALDAATTTGRVAWEARIMCPDGTMRWVETRGEVVSDGPDAAPHLMGTVLDITDRKRAEETLGLQDLVIRNMQDAVCLTDVASSLILFVNAKFEALYGFAGAELLGKPVRSIGARVHAASWEIRDEVRGALAAHGVWNGDLEDVNAAGERFWCHTTISALEHGALGRVWLSVHRDITDRKRAALELARLNETLEALATHDPLTGLLNRRHLDDVIAQQVRDAARDGYPVAFIMIDLDQFKVVNDTLGHPAGDRALAALAGILRANTRGGDMACRFGGEEFLVVLPRCTASMAVQRADQIRTVIAGPGALLGPDAPRITISAGVASFPAHGASAEGVMAAADRALYAAKAAGRNCVRVADAAG